MRRLQIYNIAADLAERYMAENDPTKAWPEDMVLLIISASTRAFGDTRLSVIATLAFETLPAERQAALLAEYDIPGEIRAGFGQNLEWPEPRTPADETLDLDAYKARALLGLNMTAEAQAHRVVWGGDRLSQSYRKKEEQARKVLAADDADALPEDEIRYIHGEALATERTRLEVATGVIFKAVAWEQWDASVVEPARQVAQAQVADAVDVEGVNQAIEAAKALIVGAMDLIVNAPETGADEPG